MAKYKVALGVVVEAEQWMKEGDVDGVQLNIDGLLGVPAIRTQDGVKLVMPKCWIVKYPMGDVRVVDDRVFRACYELLPVEVE